MQLTFISSKDAEDKHSMHSKSNRIKFTSYNDANEVVMLMNSVINFVQDIKEIWKYQWDEVKVKVTCNGSCIDFPEWIKKKKAK